MIVKKLVAGAEKADTVLMRRTRVSPGFEKNLAAIFRDASLLFRMQVTVPPNSNSLTVSSSVTGRTGKPRILWLSNQ